ncbi:helix-turn-helix domain-containing protein [Nocardia cyriacigeorgica]|uniref:helix-turn-helix domain-containing protein n=1 Tax=Nocardia cyriacigeorgica TaxID=135487 RepID=UPI0034DB46A2
MVRETRAAPIGDGSALEGRVSGAALAVIRRQLGLSQDALATSLGVGVKTVGAWEQGRNPLIRLPYSRLRQLSRALSSIGAALDSVAAFETALSVDDILSGLDEKDPRRHPLALTVPDRTTTEMLMWPFTGVAPRQLGDGSAALHIPAGQRTEAVGLLRALAESAGDSEQGAMLRRQAVFLVATHDAAHKCQDQWAFDQIKKQVSAADLRRWSPEWAVARSAAIRAASAGDPEPLHRFVAEGMNDPDCVLANLRYWAYWVGEFSAPWSSDADMVRPDRDSWSGEHLLRSLLSGVAGAPYRELCAHTLWALARARRTLVTHPRWASLISTTVDEVTAGDGLTVRARQLLEQVHYLVGSTEWGL